MRCTIDHIDPASPPSQQSKSRPDQGVLAVPNLISSAVP